MTEKEPHADLKQRLQKCEQENARLTQQIQEMENRYHAIAEDLPVLICTFLPDSTITFVNRAYCACFDRTETELVGTSFLNLIPESERRTVMEKIASLTRASPTISHIHRVNAPDGTIRWQRWIDRAIFDPRGRLSNFLSTGEDVTAQMLTEQALRESEERFDLAMQFANDGLFDWNLETDSVYYSPGWKKMIGYADDEITHRFSEWERLTDPDGVARSRQIIQGVIDGRLERFENEFRMRHKAGHWVDILARGNVVRDETGKTVRVVGTHVDITDRKRMENALRHSERELQLMLDATTDGIWRWDFRTEALFFSPKYYTMLGYPPDAFEATFENWLALIHPDDRESALSVARTYLATKPDLYENEFRMKTREGEYRWIRARARVGERNEDGEALYLIGTHEDITLRKRTETALRESRRKFQAMVDNIGIGVALISPNMEILELNRQMRLWFPNIDTQRRPVCYRTFNQPPRDGICDYCPTIHTLRDGQVHEDTTATPRGNAVVNYRIISSPVRNDKGEVIAAIEMVEDITERQQMEAIIRQAQRMESIGNLAGGIAHDFNNILFPILGLAELLVEDLPAEGYARENAEEIMRAAMRGSDLVKQILTFSRQAEHKKMPIRIQQVLKEVLKLCRASIPSDFDLQQQIRPDCGFVMADPTQLHQIAMNLITNAYHAIEATGGEIRVALSETEVVTGDAADLSLPAGRYAVLSVSDTGHGIPPDVMEKIFEPYFTTKEEGKGTGLGLAVVYGIVKDHGGTVRVASDTGIGSRFTVYLPVIAPPDEIKPSGTGQENLRGTERILVVDDESSIIRLETQILERLGYRVTAFSGSSDALSAFRSAPGRFDLILTDMNMPRMTGIALAREIREIRTDIPIIICTGFSDRVDAVKAESLGINGFLMKPIVKSDMVQLVRDLLDRHAGGELT